MNKLMSGFSASISSFCVTGLLFRLSQFEPDGIVFNYVGMLIFTACGIKEFVDGYRAE